jgi:hypothetical protein
MKMEIGGENHATQRPEETPTVPAAMRNSFDWGRLAQNFDF